MKQFVVYNEDDQMYVEKATSTCISGSGRLADGIGSDEHIQKILAGLHDYHKDFSPSFYKREMAKYFVLPVVDGQPDYSSVPSMNVDDMEGERECMRAESQYRELTEDERYIYSL